jgi:hypothetical protein
MAHKISVRAGFQVNIPGVGEVDGPVTNMVVSDATFEALNPNSMSPSDSTKPLIDGGFIDSSGDAVLTQAAVVAAPAALTATAIAAANAATQTGSYVQADVQTIATLANELKTDYTALLADVTALRTTVANVLTELKGVGKPMAAS